MPATSNNINSIPVQTSTITSVALCWTLCSSPTSLCPALCPLPFPQLLQAPPKGFLSPAAPACILPGPTPPPLTSPAHLGTTFCPPTAAGQAPPPPGSSQLGTRREGDRTWMQEVFIVPRGAGETVGESVGKTQRGWLPRVGGGRGTLSRARRLLAPHAPLGRHSTSPGLGPAAPRGPFACASCPAWQLGREGRGGEQRAGEEGREGPRVCGTASCTGVGWGWGSSALLGASCPPAQPCLDDGGVGVWAGGSAWGWAGSSRAHRLSLIHI